MPGLQKFNPVSFSKNITKTIDVVEQKIGKAASAPKTLTNELNAKTGINIALPPLPPINADVKSIVSSVKTLVKNPSGVVKGGISATSDFVNKKIKDVSLKNIGSTIGNAATGIVSNKLNSLGVPVQGILNNPTGLVNGFAKTSFGVASVAVKSSLGQISLTLNAGIKNCLRSAVSSLLTNISVPNIPFGGIVPNIPNGISVNGIITSAGIIGAIDINAKINKHLNTQIKLLVDLQQKKLSLLATVSGNLNILKDVKNTNYYTAKINSEVNNSINKVCNTLSPRNRKKLSKGGPLLNLVANQATNVIVNNLENQIVKAASGFSAKSPKDFFNPITGKPSYVINKATGKVSIAAESIAKTVDTTAKSVVTAVDNTASSIVSNAVNSSAKAYNNIKDALNSNVPKQN